MGTYSLQPNALGSAVVQLGSSHSTYGVLIIPTVFGTDPNGSYFFQLAELTAAGI
jgi:hypothetical protein